MNLLLRRGKLCITPRFIWGLEKSIRINSVGVSQLLNRFYDNSFIITEILVNNWQTPTEFSQSVIYCPPDKSGGYAQKTLTELHAIDQYLIYQIK